MAYPNTPGSKTGGASADAAKQIDSRVKKLRAAIETLMLKGYRLTADEIADHMKESILAIRPRCTELVKSGVLIKLKDRRKNVSGMSAHLLRHRDMATEVALPAPEPVVKPSKPKALYVQQMGRIKRSPAPVIHADQNALFGGALLP